MRKSKNLLQKGAEFMSENDFHTQKAYISLSKNDTTETMEDYIEMIVRHCGNDGFVRVSFISERLNVTPSSVSKMMSVLRENGYVSYERYGIITPTKKGVELGNYLLYRHNILQRFFRIINNSDSELELTEKIEHFFDKRTIQNIEKILPKMTLINENIDVE